MGGMVRNLLLAGLAFVLAGPAAAEPGAAPPPPRPFSKAAVLEVVAERSAEVQACYEQTLASRGANRRNAPGGRVTMAWTIGPEGYVRDVTVKRTTLRDRQLVTCIEGAIAGWEFPPPGRPQPIVFPFDLVPVNGIEEDRKGRRTGAKPGRGPDRG